MARVETVSFSGASGNQWYYFIWKDSARTYAWNGSAFVVFSDANWLTFKNILNETESSGNYVGPFPTLIGNGRYPVTAYQQVGDEAAVGDGVVGQDIIEQATDIVPTPSTLSGNNTAYYTAKLAAIDTAINKLLASPRPDYKVGSTSMNFADLLEKLEKMRDRCVFLLNSLQSESFETINTDVNQFGQDIADYINEAYQ